MENEKEYVFIETDFSKTYRSSIMKEFDWRSFPIVVRVDCTGETLIGGYDELSSHLALNGEVSSSSKQCTI